MAETEIACADYLDAWARKDLDAIGARIYHDVVFKSPTASTTGRAAYLAATARFLTMVEQVVVRGRFVSGDRAMFAYDFVCHAPVGVCPTAELIRVEDGLVRESEIFFDARPFEALARARAANV
jgi:hypothetical protein